jgi:hypothetical protein
MDKCSGCDSDNCILYEIDGFEGRRYCVDCRNEIYAMIER